ncbi:DNA alkylation repair protein [Paenibacillus glycanilyticus]|uniref:DNA alkylation repair protein n=1 Tax=Paenibacillus glycanilyticus TaxID=126569 RepID=UPI00203D6F16|nr:DNA alkylation repair protein [Paenibacillus glycanilyticus]MCM3627557.1 DNA alkylation repair protein [Paenibacillus glycanilyticus]
MAEPLKDMYDEAFLRQFADKVLAVYPAFNQEAFVSDVLNDEWEQLQLKGRIRQISTVLGRHLPSDYMGALDVLYAICEQCSGFPYLFFPDFVEVYGGAEEHWELSMQALERFTTKSSAEFAVRVFLIRDPERMMRQMLAWASHPNEHVRRLASEGCRPRLPWGQALPVFKRDPSPLLPVLELLKEDPSLYVRKSVANNLNDIAKDHPDVVLQIARRWQGHHAYTDWIIRHACRNLVRQANPEALAIFGYAMSEDSAPIVISADLQARPSALEIGDSCRLEYAIQVQEGEPLHIRIEYGIDFVKSGGKTSRKLFLLSDKTVPGGSSLSGSRVHRFADLSTRRHYAGEHRIVLMVNGVEVANTAIDLRAAASE